MNVAYINPFIESTVRSLDMMAGIKAEKVGLELKEDHITAYEISTIIGLTGETTGSIIISMPSELACKIASNMLMEEITAINKNVEDGACLPLSSRRPYGTTIPTTRKAKSSLRPSQSM